jgi:aminoglycoside/choline kinase family phosphotransferase
MDFRLVALERWLGAQFPAIPCTLAPLRRMRAFGATFARASRRRSFIVMDAPPDKEDCRPFLHVAALFSRPRRACPAIHAQDLAAGFLLLEDLGESTFLDAFERRGSEPALCGRDRRLVRIQLASRPASLPEYDRRCSSANCDLFPDWYMRRQLRRSSRRRAEVLAGAFESLLANNLAQPRVTCTGTTTAAT